MMANPLVSVITPTLNAERYLNDCIASVLNQSYTNIEHVFVDGGSTDSTIKQLNQYRKYAPYSVLIIPGDDKGVGRAVNQGIRASRGEIVSWLDSDDYYESDAVEKAAEYFNSCPEAQFIYGMCNEVDQNGKVRFTYPIEPFDARHWAEIWVTCKPKPLILCCSCFWKKDLMNVVGYFNQTGNDLDWLIRVNKMAKLQPLAYITGNWRLNPYNISMSDNLRSRAMRRQVFREFYQIAKHEGINVPMPDILKRKTFSYMPTWLKVVILKLKELI